MLRKAKTIIEPLRTKLTIFDSKKSEQNDFPLACHWLTGTSHFFLGRVFTSETQISEIHVRKLGGPLLNFGTRFFNKNKTTAVPPVDAPAAFVLVQPNHLAKSVLKKHLATFSQTCSTHTDTHRGLRLGTPEFNYRTAEQSSTWFPCPQVTADPSGPRSQRRHKMPPESAAHPWADLETAELSPPNSWSPQVTTDPSAKIAANAPSAAWICCTPLSWSWTAELSPPNSWSPQVTTEPSAKIAANAPSVAWIRCTPLSWSWTAELSPPHQWSPQVTTDPSAKIAAKAQNAALNLLHTPELILKQQKLSPPQLWSPQVTTDPSAKIAANAPAADPSARIRAKAQPAAWIRCTPFSWSWTPELSPPPHWSPQVTTDPSAKIAANAPAVAWIYIYVVVRASALDLRLAQRQRAVTKH